MSEPIRRPCWTSSPNQKPSISCGQDSRFPDFSVGTHSADLRVPIPTFRYGSALTAYQHTVTLYRRHGDRLGDAQAFSDVGTLCSWTEATRTPADAFHRQAVAILADLVDRWHLAVTLPPQLSRTGEPIRSSRLIHSSAAIPTASRNFDRIASATRCTQRLRPATDRVCLWRAIGPCPSETKEQ